MLGHLEAMLGLYWANKGFVGSFWGSTFNPKGSGVRLMLGHLEAMLGSCLEYKAMREPNLASRFGLATRMQDKQLICQEKGLCGGTNCLLCLFVF